MSFACPCGSKFTSLALLSKHADGHGHHLSCDCGRMFKDQKRLDDHRRDMGHGIQAAAGEKHAALETPADSTSHVCTICENKFAKSCFLERHMRRKHPSWSCPSCAQSFSSPEQRDGHQRVTGHCYCDEHSITFDSTASFNIHRRATGHIAGFECLDCERTFGSELALDHHLQSPGHAAVALAALDRAEQAKSDAAAQAAALAAEEDNLRCEECNKDFKNLTAFKQHKDSIKHKPLSNLQCPMSEKCKGSFKSPSALLLHLESGKCKSGMNRFKLNALAHAHDTGRHITYAKNAVSVISTASAAGSLPDVGGIVADMSALTTSSRRPGVLTPSASSQNGSMGGISIQIEDIEEDDESIASESTTKVPINTSGTSRRTSSTNSAAKPTTVDDVDDNASTVTDGTSNGVPVYTPATSRRDSTSTNGGVILTPPSGPPEWSFLNDHNTAAPHPPASITEDTMATITYDSTKKIWPCPVTACKRTFQRKNRLLQHLSSPAHTPELFHCPKGLEAFSIDTKGKEKAFRTLSSFAQHIEAGACAGGKDALKHIAGMFESEISKVTGRDVKLLK